MKGNLVYNNSDKSWSVEYKVWDDDKIYTVPIWPPSMLTVRFKPGMEVEFAMTNETSDGVGDQKRARIIPPNTKEGSWDSIFQEIEGPMDVYIPIRIKNWLKNTYHTPIKIRA